MNYLIRGMVLPMTGAEDFYPDGEIAVHGDRIGAVGERGAAAGDFRPDRIIDLPQHVIMPGLINTHTHAAMTLLRGYADDLPLMPWLEKKVWPYEAKMSAADIYWGSALALCEMLKSGTTTMVDMYMSQDETARAVLEAGTRALLARGAIVPDPETGRKAIEESSALFHKFHNQGNGRLKVLFGPHAPYTCTGEFLREVKQEADRLGTGMHIHLAETQTELAAIRARYGTTPVRWLESLGFFGGHVIAAHGVHLDEEEIGLLAEYGVGVAHNPESNMKLSSGTAPIPRLLAAGVAVGLGTDGPSSNNDLDMFGEMRSAAFQQKLVGSPEDLKAYTVLEMATAGGARVAGIPEIGKLAPGYKADLIAVNLNQPHFYPRFSIPSHLVYCAGGRDVTMAMVDGKILMEERRLLTLDEQRICREVEKRAKIIAFAAQ